MTAEPPITPTETTDATKPTPPVITPKTLEELQKEEEATILKQLEAEAKTEAAEANKNILQELAEAFKNQQEQLNALRKDNEALVKRLDVTFQDIQNGFVKVAEAMRAQPTHALSVGQQAQPEEGGVMGIINKIAGAVEKAVTTPETGSMSEMDREILRMSKQFQVMQWKSMLKTVASKTGMPVPEEHVVVSP